MTKFNTDRIVGVYAPSRYGKTNVLANLISTIPIPIIIFDTNLEWTKRPELIKKISGRGVLVASPQTKQQMSSIAFLNKFIKEVRNNASNIIIYIEDLEVFFNEKSNPKDFFGEIKDLAERGGHSNISLWYSSKQLKYIPRTVISNTNLFYFGSFMEREDINLANNLCSPEYDVRKINKPNFIRVDRWDMSKKIVCFDKVF